MEPDYEVPGGHNENGVYGVVIRVSDGESSYDDQPLWVWINDVNEAPYNILHTPTPRKFQKIRRSVRSWVIFMQMIPMPIAPYIFHWPMRMTQSK